MLTLMELPNEILSSIIEATEPEDIVSFSTCCKLMYGVARHRLEEHKEKKSLFSTIFVNDHPVPRPLCGAEYDKLNTGLRDLFSDERNRLYPKTMVLSLPEVNGSMNEYDNSRTARTSALSGLDKVEQQLEFRMAEVHSMIGLEIGGVEAKEWGKHVKAGDPVAIFLLLLALLPNLEKCSIKILGDWHQGSSANYLKITRLIVKAALGQEENGLRFGGRLSKCTIEGNFSQSLGKKLLRFIMMLPRMKIIHGSCLEIEDGSRPFKDAVSPVVDLDLHGAIETVSLSNYVRGIRELKRFQYTFAGDPDIYWEPCEIVATLEEFAFRSLVHLDLTANVAFSMVWSDISPGIGSLRSFEVLETVRLQYYMLFEEDLLADSAEGFDLMEMLGDLLDKSLVKGRELIDFLPSSLRTFQLEGISKGRLILDTLEGFPEHRVEILPNLELISLDAGDEFNGQIEKICKEAGVQMRVNQG